MERRHAALTSFRMNLHSPEGTWIMVVLGNRRAWDKGRCLPSVRYQRPVLRGNAVVCRSPRAAAATNCRSPAQRQRETLWLYPTLLDPRSRAFLATTE